MNRAAQKILVVEDDKFNREIVTTMLADCGFTMFSAHDGEEGLAIMSAHPEIVVVITDIYMPKKEGVTLIRALRRLYPLIKIVAMTGAVNHSSVLSTADEFGADLTLRKPFDFDLFVETIMKVVDNEQMTHSQSD